MSDDVTTAFETLHGRQLRRPVTGTVAVRIWPADDIQAAARPVRTVLLSLDEGVVTVDELARVQTMDAEVDVRQDDLESLIRGEDTLDDLVMTRRLVLSGRRRDVGHAGCLAIGSALSASGPDAGADYRLRRFPAVQIRAAREVVPFDPTDAKSLPIIVNAFNRLTCLRLLVERLRWMGYWNLYVIDNASDYQPLLDYYRETSIPVFALDKNVGCYALWRTAIGQQVAATHYAFTDPDILPIETCPDDFVSLFLRILEDNPGVGKVGFGLRIDDIPIDAPNWQEILRHEMAFWRKPIGADLYDAPIDTTFAIYRPGVRGGYWIPAIRTAGNYMARHLPWYASEASSSEEDIHYGDSVRRATHWTARRAQHAPSGLAADGEQTRR